MQNYYSEPARKKHRTVTPNVGVFLLKERNGGGVFRNESENYIKAVAFSKHKMAFGSRTRIKNEILIALDVVIQDAQAKLNGIAEDQKEAGVGAGAVGSELYLQNEIIAFNRLKASLLANIKKIDGKVSNLKDNIAIITGKR